ncbi:reverse transcriptase domain-containing protein [Photorhabdus khanii]|uniref:reverse transcriptase domain-containing protein n=1 Tax=Photorhabdus khanii TaxID=1004150 RepID=UPI002F2614A5
MSYADDGLVHCQNEAQAREIWQMLEQRFRECGLAPHPDKTRIAYCKDVERKGKYEHSWIYVQTKVGQEP